MGQSASTGLSQDSGAPVGYQPEHGPSPLKFKYEDGTWQSLRAKDEAPLGTLLSNGGPLHPKAFNDRSRYIPAPCELPSFQSEEAHIPPLFHGPSSGSQRSSGESPDRFDVQSRYSSAMGTCKGGTGPEDVELGAVVEVYSATSCLWYPAAVTGVDRKPGGLEVLTVYFFVDNEPKQKSVLSGDSQLAPLGTHTGGQLPPGFQRTPSQSRPGHFVYMDATTGIKYATAQLAWRLHFQRLSERGPEGLQTVQCVTGLKKAPLLPVPTPPASEHGTVGGRSDYQPRPLTLAALAELSVAGDLSPHDMSEVSGKVPLPNFSDSLGSQAAYLSYVGASGPDAAPAGPMVDHVGYPILQAAAPRRPQPATSTRGPQHQAWQQDPFSQWRQ